MAKRKVVNKTTSHMKRNDDTALMLLAAGAAVIVGFFAIFSFKAQSPAALPTATPSQVITINFASQNKSGETGTATLQQVNGDILVTLAMVGFPKGVVEPAHIHLGSCPTPGAVKYPLTSVVNGESKTVIKNTTFSDLKALGALAVNVHKSVQQSNIYVSCGNLSF